METNHSPSSFSNNSNKQPPLWINEVVNRPFEVEEDRINLGQPFAIMRRRLGVIMGAAIALATLTIPAALWLAHHKPPRYLSSFQILVEPVTAEEEFQRLVLEPQQNPDQTGNLQTAPRGLDYDTQIEVLQSPKLLDPVLKQIQVKYPDFTELALKMGLKVERVAVKNTTSKQAVGTRLIGVSFHSTDPEAAQFVAEKLSRAYLAYSLKERQTNIGHGIKFIEQQVPKLQQRVDTLQAQLQSFRQRNGVINPDLQGQQAAGQAGNLKEQEVDNKIKLAETQSRYNTLEQQQARQNSVTVLAESPQYGALLNRYQELESQIAQESARMREDNPAMQALRDQQQNLRGLLRQEAQRVLGRAVDDIEILQARNQAIQQAETEIDQQIRRYPLLARQYADLERELRLATNSLTEFQTKREALRIDSAQKEVPWELLSPPELLEDPDTGEPMNIGAANLAAYMALAAFVSTILGIATGFLVDSSSDAYFSARELKQATKLPLLGVIPLETGLLSIRTSFWTALLFWKQRWTRTMPRVQDEELESGEVPSQNGRIAPHSSSFTEAFRLLCKTIRLLDRSQTPIRSLTISSAQPEDGKSTIAVNLAQAAAAMGQRVLLVDADLRRPKIHAVLGLPNTIGLSNLITSNLVIRDALQRSPLRDNLMVLTAGESNLDPIELLSSRKMTVLMERFYMVFDLVIYDTPPLVGLADSSLIAANTDGMALVVRLGSTKRSSITHVIEELKLSSTNLLGLIANGDSNGFNMYNRYYQQLQIQNIQNGAEAVVVK
jgi:capsular exopolysaccharide synthesis family protein